MNEIVKKHVSLRYSGSFEVVPYRSDYPKACTTAGIYASKPTYLTGTE
jgi:hypothetical protein